jgi:hypothetical protein
MNLPKLPFASVNTEVSKAHPLSNMEPRESATNKSQISLPRAMLIVKLTWSSFMIEASSLD